MIGGSCQLLDVPLWVAALVLIQVASAQQPSDYSCPLAGSPSIRQGDAVAVSGGRFDSDRGQSRKHGALDLNSSVGAPVLAIRDGRAAVAAVDWDPPGMGNTVIVEHSGGEYSVYGHLGQIDVQQGATVTKGQRLGTVGYSGNAQALADSHLPPHLHFALLRAGHSGLADAGKPLQHMRAWGDYWADLGASLNGPVNPSLFMPSTCWTGSTTIGAPGEH